jgi:hypothetical protein
MESKVNRLSGPKSPFVQCASILHFHPSARLAERNTSETPECETRRVSVAGITRHPIEGWMTQMARNISDQTSPDFSGRRYLIHDRDTRICESFRSTLTAAGVNPLRLPARNPNLNAFAERWVGSVKRECLSENDLLRRADSPPRAGRVHRALSCRTQSPGQRQRHPVSEPTSIAKPKAEAGLLSPTTRWPAQILLPGRMNSLTTRALVPRISYD